MSPGDRIRCTVESLNYSACTVRVGDWFEVGPEGISIPSGGPFCFWALNAAVPLITAALAADPGGVDPLEARHLVACPDPPEAVYMRLERISADAENSDAGKGAAGANTAGMNTAGMNTAGMNKEQS